MPLEHCDCLVIGGGTAGVVAAIQAARIGGKTVLVESAPLLGGTMTMGCVRGASFFFANGRQIVGGIGWELACEATKLSGDPMPDWTTTPPARPGFPLRLDPNCYALVAEEACRKAGVHILLEHLLVALRKDAQDCWHATIAASGVLCEICAREIIDCSGNAVAVRLAGGKCVQDSTCQPSTLIFRLEGYEYEAIDADALEKAYQTALSSGELQPGDFALQDRPFIEYLRAHGHNRQHLLGKDDATVERRNDTLLCGRQRLLAMLRFLKRQPGLENCRIAWMAPSAGVRESWRILGEHTITEEEYLTGVLFPDAIAYSYYFVDIHHATGIERKFLPPNVWPTIPLRALLPKGLKHLLAAGRIVSADHAALSALRVQASCMAMGQAAGAAAALASRRSCDSRDIPLETLRAELQRHGAIVPGSTAVR